MPCNAPNRARMLQIVIAIPCCMSESIFMEDLSAKDGGGDEPEQRCCYVRGRAPRRG